MGSRADTAPDQSGRIRVCFPFVAEIHQAFHSLPIALELARRHPDIEVHLACPTEAHRNTIERLARAYAADAPVRFDLLALPAAVRARVPASGQGVTAKLVSLIWNARWFDRFDALVVPERTTSLLKRFLKHPKFIWTRHGAGDRARGFERDVARFDFVLLAGEKIERRLLDKGLIRPGHYAAGIYAKFDLVRRLPHPRLFDNDRPTILYNPHFWRSLSSWPLVGQQVLDWFAASDRYNLIFAPHIRLFHPASARDRRRFQAYAELPHIRSDLGGARSVDMSYALGADLYLGDVSSQVAEFLIRPRPCLFLNPRRTAWAGDPDYRFWELGPVIEDIGQLGEALDRAFVTHETYRCRQLDYVRETFGPAADFPTAPRGADALAEFLHRNDGNLSSGRRALPI